ncbi:MAG: beta-lactamase family protein [Burkholderiaceae bacterium]|jgi:CubicO group peptidase (beta-lactamase class C family)|nr:beta-lactamase family protein [Burkholderiaceae bacterium]
MSQKPSFGALTLAVDAVIESCLSEKLTHGTVTLVSYDGQMVYHRAAGLADPDSNIPMREDSLFRLASITKIFTSVAAAALIEQGKMRLDDPVTNWLPDFKPRTADGKVPVITIRHLLSHTAGLDYRWAQPENGDYAQAGVSDGLDISGLSMEENIRRIGSVPLYFEPGASWRYSLAPDVMGAVIARAHGSTFPDAMRDLVTAPLGMTDTCFDVPETGRGRMTAPYFRDNGQLKRMQGNQLVLNEDGWRFLFSPERAFNPNEYPSGGVGLVGTGADLMRLVEAIRTNRMPTVSEAFMRQMSTNVLPNGMPDDPSAGFGLGWGVLLDPALAGTPQSPGTLYWGGVYGHKWFADTARKLSVVIMTTTASMTHNEPVPTGIRNAIYANLPG